MNLLLKEKSAIWWIKVISFSFLFVFIFVFSCLKMKNVYGGIKIEAKLEKISSSLILVKGQAEKAKILMLNGREILINKDGYFEETITIPPGFSIITISTLDKFGKTSEKKFEVFYKNNNQVVI